MKEINIDKLIISICKDYKLYNLENEINAINKRDIKHLNAVINGTTNKPFSPSKLIFNGVELVPYKSKSHYKYNYKIMLNNSEWGELYWETYKVPNKYAFIKLNNKILYNSEWQQYNTIITALNLTVSHISVIDLCCDNTVNFADRYLRIISNKANEIVINGKLIKNRNKLFNNPYFIVSGSLNNPQCNWSINFTTIDKSLLFRGYNKTLEIIQNSGKNYQISTDEEVIYRSEISIGAKQLNRNELKNITVFELLELLKNNNYRYRLFIKYLMRLFRYGKHNKKRKTLIS